MNTLLKSEEEEEGGEMSGKVGLTVQEVFFVEVGNMTADSSEAEPGKTTDGKLLLAKTKEADSVLIQSGVADRSHWEVEKSIGGVISDEYINGKVPFIRLGLMSGKSDIVELDKSNPWMSVEDSSGQELLSMGWRYSPFIPVNTWLGGTV